MTAATRPLFPEGVEVHQADLQRAVDLTELRSNTADTARVYRGSTEVFQGGVLRGLRITRNSTTTTRFDVSSGAARTAGGYHIEVDAAVLATELSDPTDGIENFVCLVYTETDGTPRPHETANTNQNTVATPSYRVVALTEAAYNALPWSDDDYSINARDRIALLGSVFGNGSGVALVSAEIQQQDLATERIGVKYTVDDADGVLNGSTLSA